METSYNKYDDSTDEELIIRLRDGDRRIIDFIMNKYKELVRNKAKKMFILGADNDDLIQEGMIGLFAAITDYDPGRDASFYTFADLCITRKMYTAIQAAGRKKNLPLNSYISLCVDNDDTSTPLDLVVRDTVYNPEEHIIDMEAVQILEDKMGKELSSFERQVLELHIIGMGYVDIARILSKDSKSVDNALSRIKTKVKKIVEEMHS